MLPVRYIIPVVQWTVFIVFLLSFPVGSHAAQSVYTIQTGSFADAAAAQKEFDAITKLIDEDKLDYLRIEKIGKYYSIRIGKFKDRADAEKFYQPVKSSLPGAAIMDAYFKEERIIKLYKGFKTTDGQIRTISGIVDKKDYDKALKLIQAELSSRPESHELNGWYGAVLLKMNNPSGAIKYLQKAAELSPDTADYHSGIGYCLFSLNRYNAAIDEFNKAIALDPVHIDAIAGIGIASVKTGNRDRAAEAYNKLRDLDMDTAGKLLAFIRK